MNTNLDQSLTGPIIPFAYMRDSCHFLFRTVFQRVEPDRGGNCLHGFYYLNQQHKHWFLGTPSSTLSGLPLLKRIGSFKSCPCGECA